MAASTSLFANWTRLVGLILRRDRWSLPVWVVAVGAFCAGMVPALPSIGGTREQLAGLGVMMSNPAMVAMCGILYGDTPSLGIIYTQMMFVWSAMLLAVMNILLVVRHTRADEDEGRLEVIRALPTGRLSSLAAITAVMLGVNLLLALITGFGMAAFRVESVDLAGSLVYGASLGACGWLFAVIALVAIQLAGSAQAATAWSLVLVGGLYMLRAYGDVSSETAALISPFGLIERTYPFHTNRWWPVVVLLGLSVLCLVLATLGNARREVGQGLLPSRGRRRAHASRWLADEWGLAWRLCRSAILAWCATAFVLAAAYGTVMNSMEDFVLSNPLYIQMFGIDGAGGDLTGPIVSMLMLIMAILAAVPVLITANRLIGEERYGRMDYVLGHTVSRARLFAGYAGLVLLAAAGMQLAAAVGFWAVASVVMTTPVKASVVFGVAANDLAGVLVFGGLGLLLAGTAKRFAWIGWGYLGATFLVAYLGDMLKLPQWAKRLTPFGLLSRYPSEAFAWGPWIGLVLGAVVLATIGLVAYRRRDITA